MTRALGLRLRDPATFIATAGGVGLLPKAPGTWGSLVGVALAWIVVDLGGPLPLLAIMSVLFVLGWWAADRVSRTTGIADPGFIVIDEVVGQALVLSIAPLTPMAYLVGFILFRIADILKPWPVRVLDQKIHSGFGVMIDDVAAAVYATIALALGLRLLGHYVHG